MADQQAHTDACAQMGATVDAHKKLQAFMGTFAAEVKLWMAPGEPMVSTGSITNTLDLGGRFLHQVYKGDATDGPFSKFEGRGYWGYNTTSKKYEGFWIDTASTSMQNEMGDVDESGTTWTMIGEVTNPESGKPMRKRSVITLHDNDHHTIEMFFTGPDGNEFKAMEIAYARQT